MDQKQLIDDLQVAFYIGGCLGILAGVSRYIYNRLWGYEKLERVVEDIATIHLPYLYTAVRQIGTALGVTIDDAPVVTFYPQAKNPSKGIHGHN